MKTTTMIQTFTERYPFVGPLFWIASIQYYVVQLVVAAHWLGYSWANNTISDLGNTVCAPYNGRAVCSPWFNLMNWSFMLLGLTMIIGAILIYREFKGSIGSAVGFSFMAVSGIGTLMVGFFPENIVPTLHGLGATLAFLIGNLGLVVLGLSLDIPKSLRLYTLLSGYISLAALFLFLNHSYLGLGIGGMERIVAYPQTAWLIVFGVYISSSHMREG